MLKNFKNPLCLFIAALIWGVAFVSQSTASELIDPFTFNGVRNILGCLVLIPVIAFLDSRRPQQERKALRRPSKKLLAGGVVCGVLLFVAANLQQLGISMTTVGKAGFITTFYIVLVPVVGLFFKKRCPPIVWAGMVIALFGLYLLCMKKGDFSVGMGDLYVFICSLVFTFHIIAIDEFAPYVDGVRMSCIQFLVCGILSLIAMAIFEKPSLTNILAAWKPLLYTGILSSGAAYTLQIVGQKNYNSTVASLILSLESVIAALAGWLILKQALSGRELAGCIVVFFAVIMVQTVPAITEKRKARKNQ
ncbi:MAG: DMT family transporter [Oscillospiraceae bacterium]|nr:DMT family transporter [Oscillospiraceae bacterium]